MTMSTESASAFSPVSIKGLWTMTAGCYANRRNHIFLMSLVFLVLPNVAGLYVANSFAFKVSEKIKLVSLNLDAKAFVMAILETFSSDLWPLILSELLTTVSGLFGCLALAVTFRNYFKSSPLGLPEVLKDALAITWPRGLMALATLILFAIPASLFSIVRIFFACLILMVPVLLVQRSESGYKSVTSALFLKFAQDSLVNRWHALNLIFLFGGVFFGIILLSSTAMNLVIKQLGISEDPTLIQSLLVIVMGMLIPLLLAALTALYVKVEESKTS